MGSQLEFVEGVIHSRGPQEVQLPLYSNHQVSLEREDEGLAFCLDGDTWKKGLSSI